MMANDSHQADSTSEQIRAGMDRARRQGRLPGRRRVLTDENIAEARRRLQEDGERLRSIARSFRCSASTIKRALERQEAVSEETQD